MVSTLTTYDIPKETCSCDNLKIARTVASQFVITFQFVINYYKLERICNAIASQFVINYYKLERICTAAASQFVIIIYYKLGRNCITYAFQFVIIYYKLERYYKLGRNSARLTSTRAYSGVNIIMTITINPYSSDHVYFCFLFVLFVDHITASGNEMSV